MLASTFWTNAACADSPQEFQDKVFSLLPHKMQVALEGAKLKIEFSAPNGSSDEMKNLCSNAENSAVVHNIGSTSHSLYSGYTIKLHPLFLAEIAKGESASASSACGHGTYYRMAMATLIHELSHVFDKLNIENPEEKQRRESCDAKINDRRISESIYSDTFCRNILAKNSTVSESARYQKITGWQKGAFGYKYKNKGEAITAKDGKVFEINPRGINYEDKNIYEHFAVNMEYYILDPEYRCRKPALSNYFNEIFEVKNSDIKSNCKINYDINYSSNNKKVNIDPSRIYQVHYLLADKGDTLASHFGHSMFRLVICAPERTEVGPDCLQDKQFHVVLSHRANLNDLKMDYIGMVAGDKYPLKLFVMPFTEVQEEYTKTELRDLKSIPLKITQEQKKSLVDTAIEQYWGHTGRYAYLSQNCATETASLLQAAMPETSIVQDIGSISPAGVLDDMFKLGIADLEVFNDTKKAEKNGYLFPSNQKIITNAYSRLQKKGVIPVATNLEEYIHLKPQERKEMALQALGGENSNHAEISGNFYLIESYIRRKDDLAIKSEAEKIVLDGMKSTNISEKLQKRIAELKKNLEAFDRWKQAKYGYGIPLIDEVKEPPSTVNKEVEKSLAYIKDLLDKKSLDSALMNRELTIENLDCYYDIFDLTKK